MNTEVGMSNSQAVDANSSFSESKFSLDFHTLVDSLNEGIWVIDKDSVTSFVNPRMAEMLGLTVHEMVGKNLFSILKEPAANRARKSIERQKSSGSEQREFTFERKDGSKLLLSLKTGPLFNNGEYTGAIAAVQNITSAKTAEEELVKSEQRHRAILRTAMDGYWTADLNGRLLEVNQTYCQMSGYSEEELLSMNVSDVEAIEIGDLAAQHMSEIRKMGEHRFNSRHRRKDNTIFDVEVSVQYRPDENGRFVAFLRDITELKNNEEKFRQSEAKYRSLVNTSGAAIVTVELDGTVSFVNEGCCQMLGFTEKEILGLNFNKFIYPDDRPKLVKEFYDAVNTVNNHVMRYVEFRLLRKDDTFLWFGASPMPIIYGDEVVGFNAMMININEHKQAKAALRASEERYKALFENSIDAVLLTSSDGSVQAANAEACRIFGMTKQEILETGKEAIVDKTDPRLLPALEERARTGKFRGELNFCRKEGSIFPGEVSSSFFTDRDGQSRTSMIIRDVTERKRSEEALRESEERYRRIVETTSEGIMVGEPDGRITFVNQRMADMLGYKREEIVGKAGVEFLDNEEKPGVAKTRSDLASGKRVARELKFRQKNGQALWTIVSVSPLVDEQGRHIGNLSMHADITSNKKAEQALKESQANLRRFSAYLQEELESERKRLAAEIHDELGQMLTGLKIDLSWINKRLPPDSQLYEKSRSIINLVNETELVVKRISSDLRPTLLDDLGLATATEWYVKQFRKRNEIQCEFKVIPDTLEVEQKRSVDVFRILQEALTNISRHAGATDVKISMEERDGKLRLTIRDNGRGLAPSEITDSHSFGLLGMQERARRWGGTLEIKGKKSQGTTITLVIPLEEENHD